MVTNYSETNPQASPHIPSGLMAQELGRSQQYFHHYPQPLSLSDTYNTQPHFDPLSLSNPYPQPHSLLSLSNTHLHSRPSPASHSHEIHDSIQREIERRIREEIIVSEMVRRRVLEAEIRRELMLERELTLHRGTNGIPVGPPSVVGFESPTRLPGGTSGEVRSSKERLILSLSEKERLSRRLENRNGDFDTTPFQRCSTDLRFSEVRLVPEGEKDKEKLVLMRGTNGIPVGSSSVIGFESPTRHPVFRTGGEVKSSKERIILSLPEKDRSNARLENRNRDIETLPFQGSSTDLRFSEVKLVPEAEKETKDIVLPNSSKPDEDKSSGSKRKADVTLPAGPGSNEPSPDSHVVRKKGNEWSCSICQVNTPSEMSLNEHLNGRKHKFWEASLGAQRTGKDYRIGFHPKKATESVEGPEAVDLGPSESPTPLLTENVSPDSSKKTQSVVSSTENLNLDDSSKNHQSVLLPEEQMKDESKENMYLFWCELCQVRTSSEQIMDSHRRGKKHAKKLASSKQQETSKNL